MANSSLQGLQDGVDQFESHANKLSQSMNLAADEEEEGMMIKSYGVSLRSPLCHYTLPASPCPSLYWKYSPELPQSTEE